MNHKKELFKRNEKKLFLFNSLRRSFFKFNEITTTLRRAKFLKKTFTNFGKKRNTKYLFIKFISDKHNFKKNKGISNKKIRIVKREKRIGDFSSLATIQLT